MVGMVDIALEIVMMNLRVMGYSAYTVRWDDVKR
jgi:hypothetical protein